MAVPLIVVLPGLLALTVLPFHLVAQNVAVVTGQPSYNEVLPLMLVRYCGPGLLGLGVTALIAGFMSGMAGNVSAFSTVWTYDLYGAFLNKRASDRHYVEMGRWSTLVGVLISVGTAYLVQHAASIMDYAQELFSFFIAPLFGTVLLGMFWKRATAAGGFWGLLAGTCASFGCWEWVRQDPSAVRYVAFSIFAKPMAQDACRAIWAWLACVIVTVVVSLATRPRPVGELENLVYGVTAIPKQRNDHWYQKPIIWAGVVFAIFVALNIIFW
jgi:SSS family solute:Na+ symporter